VSKETKQKTLDYGFPKIKIVNGNNGKKEVYINGTKVDWVQNVEIDFKSYDHPVIEIRFMTENIEILTTQQ